MSRRPKPTPARPARPAPAPTPLAATCAELGIPHDGRLNRVVGAVMHALSQGEFHVSMPGLDERAAPVINVTCGRRLYACAYDVPAGELRAVVGTLIAEARETCARVRGVVDADDSEMATWPEVDLRHERGQRRRARRPRPRRTGTSVAVASALIGVAVGGW